MIQCFRRQPINLWNYALVRFFLKFGIHFFQLNLIVYLLDFGNSVLIVLSIVFFQGIDLSSKTIYKLSMKWVTLLDYVKCNVPIRKLHCRNDHPRTFGILYVRTNFTRDFRITKTV